MGKVQKYKVFYSLRLSTHVGSQTFKNEWGHKSDQIAEVDGYANQYFASDEGALYRIDARNRLCFLKHDWSTDGAEQVFTPLLNAWDFSRTFAGNKGAIYSIDALGNMYFSRHVGWRDGSNLWSVQKKLIGSAWNQFSKIIPGDDGTIYAMTPEGKLFYYRHVDWNGLGGTWEFSHGKRIGTDWEQFEHIVAGPAGVIYGRTADGNLYEYLHRGYRDGSVDWPKQRVPVGRKFLLKPTYEQLGSDDYQVMSSRSLDDPSKSYLYEVRHSRTVLVDDGDAAPPEIPSTKSYQVFERKLADGGSERLLSQDFSITKDTVAYCSTETKGRATVSEGKLYKGAAKIASFVADLSIGLTPGSYRLAIDGYLQNGARVDDYYSASVRFKL